MQEGIAGKIAKAFVQSKLTILLMIAFLLIGGYSTLLIPREEEPQIQVPIADIFVGYPGAAPEEVESRVSEPLEKMISNIKGVEYVYSTSMKGQSMLIVQFYVGEDVERSMVKLYDELMKNMDRMPQGVTIPMIKTRSIDDVPALSLTLWSDKESDYSLRQLSEVVTNEIKKVPDVADVNIIGGRGRQVRVLLDKDKLAEYHLDFAGIARQIPGGNAQAEAGSLLKQDTAFLVNAGDFLKDAGEIANLVVGVNKQQPIYLRQVARVIDGPATPSQYVFFGYGKSDTLQNTFHSLYPAVTLAVAKRKGADAMHLSEEIVRKTDYLKKQLIPSDVKMTVTRNYGETASEKVSELLFHLFIAIVAVTAFVMLAMGWRGGLVVFLSVPVTFALTLFSYYLLHYTLNRITLFALVFITGIVVDDSIIIAENMHRHFKLKQLPPLQAAIYAINEVGNPTILATFTVIAAVLPMAFVSGLMGPYMSPMPIGASIAMLLSLVVALTLTPYLGYLFLREKEKKHGESKKAVVPEETRIFKVYRSFMQPLLDKKWKRYAFIIGIALLLLASMSMFYTRAVAVKMLPIDNKNELQVVVDMPEGTTLEKTAAVTRDIATYVSGQPLVVNCQGYIGTSGPISFNGLVRHYDLRRGDNVADIQVNLVGKGERSKQSHQIAKEMRPGIQAIAAKYNANVKVVEVPPGPPVLSTLVAEIYGPDYKQQIAVARQVKDLVSKTADVVDVDWMVEDDQPTFQFAVDREKAMRYGVAPAQVVAAIRGALSGMPAGTLHVPASFSPVAIELQLADADKASINDIANLTVTGQQGNSVRVGDIAAITRGIAPKSIYRKNQKRVVYVLADMAGRLESPSYAMMSISDSLRSIHLPAGYSLKEEYTHQPEYEDNFSLKWDGEWQITYEVFRDLGIAFLVVLIIIYMLIVGWFQNFVVPLVMLAAIPLSLVGIILGHWLLGAFFTATSMIGFIALAGVMVRNSVLLIDFIDIRLKEGVSLNQSIIEAGAVRTTPILLTAGAVVLGAVIILFDPIFQGLAIALMGGTITSTFLTLLVVPLLYHKMLKKKYAGKK